MLISRKFILVVIVGIIAALNSPSISMANTYNNGQSNNVNFSNVSLRSNPIANNISIDSSHGNANVSSLGNRPRILNGSKTASHYYRVGVSQYEKGNFGKAEYAFKAVLRADGLDKEAIKYLSLIEQKQRDNKK